jgi:opacity protein-like surface antigen
MPKQEDTMTRQKTWLEWRRGIGRLATVALLSALAGPGFAAEIVPSVGLTKPIHGGEDANVYSGLAIRDNIAPALRGELGFAYRSESRFADQLKVRSWPVTASLYLTPIPIVYAGAGVGWYQTTFDYSNNSPLLRDETKQLFGVHVGGGMEVPLGGPAIDLNGRYVMLQDQQSRLVPEKFNPDFWTMSLGLALKF